MMKLNRRNFIKKASVTAAGAGVFSILPSEIWSSQISTDEKLNNELIGLNSQGFIRADLMMDRFVDGKDPITFHLHLGAAGFSNGWVLTSTKHPKLPVPSPLNCGCCRIWEEGLNYPKIMPGIAVTKDLSLDSKKISGILRAGIGNPPFNGYSVQCTIDAVINGEVISGKYKGSYQDEKGNHQQEGTLRGRLVSAKKLQMRDAIAANKDFPCHRGSLGSGTSQDTADELVDSIAKARLQWVSEDNTMDALVQHDAPYINGGYGGPIIADGRVYLLYYDPLPDHPVKFNSKEYKEPSLVRKESIGPEQDAKRKSYLAYDTIVCIDAANGRTLWKQAIMGLNRAAGDGSGPMNTPAYANGRIYAQGSTGRGYCFDAHTGELRWTFEDLSAFRVRREAMVQAMRGSYPPYIDKGRELDAAVQTADGVVCFAENSQSLLGVDAENGKYCWSGHGLRKYGCPVRWTHRGKEYFVTTTEGIEPRTGKTMWTVPAIGPHTPVVNEDYMVVEGQEKGLTGYKITPEKAEEIWSYKKEDAGAPNIKGFQNMPDESAMIIIGPNVYAAARPAKPPYKYGERNLRCVELATGKLVCAEVSNARNCWLGISPVAQNGRLFSGKGISEWVKADPADFRALPGGDGVLVAKFTAPAIADGRVVVRLHNGIACYDFRKKTETVDVDNTAATGAENLSTEQFPKISPAQKDASTVLQLISSHYSVDRQQAANLAIGLNKIEKKKLLKELAKLIASNDFLEREAAARVVVSLGKDANQLSAPLRTQLIQSVKSNRMGSALVFAEALIACDAEMVNSTTLELLSIFRGSDESGIIICCKVLETQFKADGKAAIPELVVLMRGENDYLAEYAAKALEEMAPATEGVLREMIACIGSPKLNVAMAAAAAAAALGLKAKTALPAIDKLKSDKLWKSLLVTQINKDEIMANCRLALRGADSSKWEEAAMTLLELNPNLNEEIAGYLVKGMGTREPAALTNGLKVFPALNFKSMKEERQKEILDLLMELLSGQNLNNNDDVGRTLVLLGAFGSRAEVAIPLMKKYVQDNDKTLATLATNSIKQIKPDWKQ